MDVPPIHRCLWLCAENDHLQRKLKKLRQKNELLESDLSEIQEKHRLQQMMRDLVTTRDAQMQTEPQAWLKAGLNAAKADVKRNRLLHMYNALQKRYEEEIKSNKEQSKTISRITVTIHELELQLVTAKQRIQQLENLPVGRRRSMSTAERDSAPGKRVSGDVTACSHGCNNIEHLFKIEKLKNEIDKLTKEKNNLKNELAGLDKGFFEEIEDLKYALQESGKLNKEYEKCLQRLCEKQGLPFPMVTK
ncbi:centrosomal protein of 290 kDa-like [Amblyraja radiata]|uniref:centrosomal protein of 290 kDa-like n=1 Tax=Amblyraja radiata TaxID=386614 RepID=UPI001403CA9E|nr:centrosomal protein of 290 kDa-like [Amblyraja radiata]